MGDTRDCYRIGHLFPAPTGRGEWGVGSWTAPRSWPDDACLGCGTLLKDTPEESTKRRVAELLREANYG